MTMMLTVKEMVEEMKTTTEAIEIVTTVKEMMEETKTATEAIEIGMTTDRGKTKGSDGSMLSKVQILG